MGDDARDEIPAELGVAEGVLGRGASGRVYLVRRPDGARVAVKVLRRELAEDPALVARFRQEARALRAVRHPGVLRVLDDGALPDGRPYLVTEHLDGETLAERLRGRDAPLSIAEAWGVIRAAGEALEAAHARGVIHRDVKPANLVLTRAGRAVLMDFGLARLPVPAEGVRSRTGAALGTPAYMSPELWWGAEVTPAVDQYGLGVTAYELLTGRPPFDHEALPELLQAHLERPPPRLDARAPGAFREDQEAWLARCLAKRPEDRFASMRELLDAGERCFSATRQRRWSARPWLAAVACAGAAVAAGYGGSHDPREWGRLAGWSWVPVAAVALAGVLGASLRARRAAGLSVLVGALGVLGAATGFAAVERGLRRAPPTLAFELFNLGIAEANSARFLGAVAAAAIGLGGDAFASRAPGRRRRALALAWLALAAVGGLSGDPSVALIALCASAIDALRAPGLGPAAWSMWATLAACSAALARASGATGRAWEGDLDRAARALVLTDAAAEQRAALVVAALALAQRGAELAVALRETPRRRLRGVAALALAWLAVELGFEARVASRRAALYADLAPQFALLARLDPPVAQGLPRPSRAPSLRVGRDAVAVDDAPSTLPEALSHPLGRGALAVDLSHRLARGGGRRLALMADREVAWAVVARALEVAWGVGVREVEVMFTRGGALTLPAGAPPEASYALPRDFGVVRLRLSDREGERPPLAAPFGEVARAWPGRADLTLRVP